MSIKLIRRARKWLARQIIPDQEFHKKAFYIATRMELENGLYERNGKTYTNNIGRDIIAEELENIFTEKK